MNGSRLLVPRARILMDGSCLPKMAGRLLRSRVPSAALAIFSLNGPTTQRFPMSSQILLPRLAADWEIQAILLSYKMVAARKLTALKDIITGQSAATTQRKKLFRELCRDGLLLRQSSLKSFFRCVVAAD